MTKPFVSVLMPAYNEGAHIRANLEKVRATLEDMQSTCCKDFPGFEIVVVNDGSTDNTQKEIETAAARCDTIKCVNHSGNRGKCVALRTAFQHSGGKFVFFLDSDLEIDPAFLEPLFQKMQRDGCDAVWGSKQKGGKEHYPFFRRIASKVFSAFVHLLLPLPIKDTQTGLKLFRRELLERVFDCMLVRRYAFDVELAALAYHNGFSLEEEPVTVNFRGGRGSLSMYNVFNMTLDILAIFYRLKILAYYDSWVPKRNKETPFISIVIAVKGDNPYLRQSVKYALAQDYPKERYEVIVLPDEPVEFSEPGVRVVPSGPELPAIKRNMGVEAARGEIIAFLDDDAYPRENWLSELAGNFTDERLAGVGGPGTTPQEDSFWQKVGGAVYESKLMSGGYSYRYLVDRRRMVDDYPTCNLALRKDVFQEAGGFQTNFWPGEDTELCLTVTKKLNYSIVYDPLVEVCHHRRHLFKGHFRQLTQYALHRGYFVKKFPETSRKPAYFVPSLFLLGVLLGPLTFFFPTLRPLSILYIAVLVFYFALSFFFAFILHPKLSPFTVLGVFLSHLAYGWYFLVGLFSRRLRKEEEYHAKLRKDHEK